MKARTILAVAAAAITLTSSALGDKYSDLVAKGYRWSTVDGLYAWVSKDDVRRTVNNPTSPGDDEVDAKNDRTGQGVLSDTGNDRSAD